ncbi:MAG: oligosaccharide flippase family protein [Candidatus Micrarchaeia archaeon]
MKEETESIGRRSVRTLSSLLIGRAGSIILNAITFIAVARLLGPSSYGIYTLAVGIYSLIGAVGHFGIGTYFNKHISEYIYRKKPQKINEVLSAGYSIILPIALALTLIGIAGSGTIASYFKSQSLPAITVVIASLILFFSMLYGAVYPALVSFGRGRWAAYTIIVVQLANLVGSVSLILAGLDYNGALIGSMLSYAVGFALTFYYIAKAMKPFGGFTFIKVGFKKIKKALYFSLPMAANNFVNNSVLNFGTVMLSLYTISTVLGNYGVALKGLNLLQVFYGTISVVLLPTFSAIIARKSKVSSSFNKVLIYSLIITLPVIFYIGIFSKPLISFLITKKYSTAPFYLLLISLGTALGLPALYSSSFIVGKGKVLKVLKYSTFSAVIQFLALLYLVPSWGAFGAITSIFIIGGLINDFLFLSGVKRLFGVKVELGPIIKIFGVNFLLAALMAPSFLLHSDLLVLLSGLLIGTLLYPILLLVSKTISMKSINDIKGYSQDIPIIGRLTDFIISYLKYFVRER